MAEGGSRGFGSGGVGGSPRDGANFATCVVFLTFLTRTKRRKMTVFFEGYPVGWGGTHRSWPGDRAVVGGGVGAGWKGRPLGLGWGSGGGPRASVGARAPGTEQISQLASFF